MVMKHLDELDIHYNYIDCDSEYGKQLVTKYNIDELPYIYDDARGYTIKEILTL